MESSEGLSSEELIKISQDKKGNKKTEEISEQNKIDKILGDCTKLTPLKFVETIEKFYHAIVNKSVYDSLNILSSYKEKHAINYHLIDFKLKTQNNTKLLKKINEINCVKVVQDLLFTGENNGFVYMYKIEKGLELEGFGMTEFNSPVSAIENKGTEFLLVGYENGTINLFDINKVLLIKTINDIHKTKILALKFISFEKKNFQLISTDNEGQVMHINSSNTLLNKKTIGNIIYKDSELTYSITKLKPYEDKKFTLYIFSSTNKVRVYAFEQKFVSIYEINKPNYAEKDDIPDTTLGWGFRPVEEGISLKKKKDIVRKKELLLAVGWGNAINIYGFFIGQKIEVEGPLGFYKNNCSIIRLGFIFPTIIYFFDKNGQIKAINTAFFNYGKIEDNKTMDNKNALIDEGNTFRTLKYNNISKTAENKYLSYRNFIYNMKGSIYLFTKEGLNIGKILDYKECIENIIKSGNNYFSGMYLGIDIYKGNIKNFVGLPLDEEERKKKISPFLINILNQYIDYCMLNANSDLTSNSEVVSINNNNIEELGEEKIIECINVTIEFCIEINEVDYLLKDVEQTFSKYGKGDLFYKLFEPYIFKDRLLQQTISKEALTSLYGAYKMKNELILLSHLFTHINLNNLNNIIIKRIAVVENIFNLIIFIFSNGEYSEDFFLPISRLFNAYSKASETKQKVKLEPNKNNKESEYDYFSYYDLFVKRGIKGINEMELCKEYIGHKLLWYIDMCLKGNKYASGTEVDILQFDTYTEKYKKFIAYIYFWILQEKIFFSLLEFDSFSLFSILIIFFTEQKIVKIIQNYDFSTINADLFQKLIKDQEDNTYFTNIMKQELEKELKEKEKEKERENQRQEQEQEKTEQDNLDFKQSKSEIITDERIKQFKEEEERMKTKSIDKVEVISKEAPLITPSDKKEKDKKNEIINPFATSEGETKYGQGVKLNNFNSVLEYIILLVESQKKYLYQLDLSTFLIKYAVETKNPIPENLRKKILEGFINLLKFFSDYRAKRKDLIAQKSDKFNIHNLSKKILGSSDPYFNYISKLLNGFLKSKESTFSEEELYKLQSPAQRTQFTEIKVKIAELSKKYGECLEIYFKEENPKLREEVFNWLDLKFQYFIDSINDEKNKRDNEIKENRLNQLEKDYNAFTKAVIMKSFDLAKLRCDKTKKIVGKYFDNSNKLKVYRCLNEDPEIQFEFLSQLLYEYEELNEEENLNDNNEDEEKVIDMFKLYVNNKSDKNSIKEEKKVREEFDKLLLDQIHLLIVLRRKPEIIKYLERNIKNYQNYPLREALKECVENDITDSAVYIYQTLGENRSALKYTKENLDKSFEKYIHNNTDNKDFLNKLKICMDICRKNSESLMKKETNDKEKGKKFNEREELWFDLLKKLYEFEERLEKDKKIDGNNKKNILETLEKSIEGLLREMCSYVSLQNLVRYVTEDERAQYKEFKSILESMLRSNTSFDRVLNSVSAILKDSIDNSESERKKKILKGNNYEYKKCDVCKKNYNKDEKILLFGCGHQSHEECCYKRKLKDNSKNKNKIIISDEEEEKCVNECEICRKNKIEKKRKLDMENENNKNAQNQNVINEETNEIIDKSPLDNKKAFKLINKKEKFRKLAKYDKNYKDITSMFY